MVVCPTHNAWQTKVFASWIGTEMEATLAIPGTNVPKKIRTKRVVFANIFFLSHNRNPYITRAMHDAFGLIIADESCINAGTDFIGPIAAASSDALVLTLGDQQQLGPQLHEGTMTCEEDGFNFQHMHNNRGKKSLAMDLKHPRALEVLEKLVR